MPRNILLVKMSSLGDLLHTMPAVTDALQVEPDLKIDWLCEEPFVDIASLHPGVRVIPHGRLRWRKSRFARATLGEQIRFYRELRKNKYDLVIDAQGRVKSARVARIAGAPVYGPDRHNATDAITHWLYHHGVDNGQSVNAVEKNRLLFAGSLGYELAGKARFGIDTERLAPCVDELQDHIVFLHGTTWESKLWPEVNWINLMALARDSHTGVLLPWSNQDELARAERIVEASGWGCVLPKMSLWNICGLIARSRGVAGVDTGLMHVAAAMGVATVSVYGSTSVAMTGAAGEYVKNLQADYSCSPCRKKVCDIMEDGVPPCYNTVTADDVWRLLNILIAERVT